MPSPFHRTLRSLQADGAGHRLATAAVILALVAAWTSWLVLARVTLYAVSTSARLEVDQESHPVEAPVAGRVTVSQLSLGSSVKQGDLLVELDSEPQRLELDRERASLSAIGPQLKALRSEVAQLEQAQRDTAKADSARLDEERARSEESTTAARLAEDESARTRHLFEAGAVHEGELRRAQAESEQRRAAASAMRIAVERTSWEQRTAESNRRATLERLQREAATLEGELHVGEARIAGLENEIRRRRIVAPATGLLGEVRPVKLGQYLEAGARLASVVPSGGLRAVAQYDPASAIGRVRPGASALLRLSGFPWTQYGCLRAVVRSVGQEIRDGQLRVELELEADPSSRIPLQHGLPGTVEIAAERVSPLSLLLRLAGGWVEG